MEIALTFCSLEPPAQCINARLFEGFYTLCSLGDDCKYGSEHDRTGNFVSIRFDV